jgi:hypothetical protein
MELFQKTEAQVILNIPLSPLQPQDLEVYYKWIVLGT